MASERDAIAATSTPATVSTIIRDLKRLGLESGDVVLVHSSLSALGWVAGAAQSVVEALLTSVGPGGTVVMPAQSGHLSDPVGWSHPPVPEHWIETIRQETPAFDRYLTPTRGMGQVVECFRQHRATIRSNHPTDSFVANGPLAIEILADHPLTPGLGEGSPLSRLYALDAKVLLLGVSHANDTSLHLAEYRASQISKPMRREGGPMLIEGRRTWVSYEDLELDDSDFPAVGEAFAATGAESVGSVGVGTARLFRQKVLVDFAAQWMEENRPKLA